ncbi:MAG: hypothetical protein KC503_01860, partial [Myxococcales bacterium]|nr:hypothetical protein [Myxococcales bacterium]
MTRANTIADVFWQAAEAPSDDRTAHDVVLHALLALRAFDAGDVRSPKDGNPLRLMGLVAEMGLEEDLVYASPELVRGETFDVRALVFTLGVLIFERLTDRHPFGSSDNPTRLARLRRGEMGSGVNYLPSVPKDLRAILMRAMGPFPEERYGTLAELRSELAEFVGRDDLAVGHDSEQDAKPRSSRHAPTGDQTLPVIPAREKRPGSGQVARLGEHKPPAPETPPEPAPDDSRVAGAAPAHESRSRRPDPPPRPPAPTPAELADVLEPEPEPPDLSPLPPAGGSRATTPAHAAAPAAAARPKMAPLLYALVGAAVASALFLLAGRGSKRQANEGSARGTTEAQPVKGAMKSPHAAAASRAKGTAGETPDTKSPVKILPPPA